MGGAPTPKWDPMGFDNHMCVCVRSCFIVQGRDLRLRFRGTQITRAALGPEVLSDSAQRDAPRKPPSGGLHSIETWGLVPMWLWLKKTGMPTWVAPVSGNMDQDVRFAPPV